MPGARAPGFVVSPLGDVVIRHGEHQPHLKSVSAWQWNRLGRWLHCLMFNADGLGCSRWGLIDTHCEGAFPAPRVGTYTWDQIHQWGSKAGRRTLRGGTESHEDRPRLGACLCVLAAPSGMPRAAPLRQGTDLLLQFLLQDLGPNPEKSIGATGFEPAT